MLAESTGLQIFETNRPVSTHIDFSWRRGWRLRTHLFKFLLNPLETFHPEAEMMESFFHAAIRIVIARHDSQIHYAIG